MSRKMHAFDDYYCRRRRLVACNATCVCVCFEERERDPQTATNQKDEGGTETAVMRSKHGAAAPRVSIFLFFVCVLNRKKRRGEIVREDSGEERREGGFLYVCARLCNLTPLFGYLGRLFVSLCRPFLGFFFTSFSSWKFEPAPLRTTLASLLTFIIIIIIRDSCDMYKRREREREKERMDEKKTNLVKG